MSFDGPTLYKAGSSAGCKYLELHSRTNYLSIWINLEAICRLYLELPSRTNYVSIFILFRLTWRPSAARRPSMWNTMSYYIFIFIYLYRWIWRPCTCYLFRWTCRPVGTYSWQAGATSSGLPKKILSFISFISFIRYILDITKMSVLFCFFCF